MRSWLTRLKTMRWAFWRGQPAVQAQTSAVLDRVTEGLVDDQRRLRRAERLRASMHQGRVDNGFSGRMVELFRGSPT